MEKYNSRKDTQAHIARVSILIDDCIGNLECRALLHDHSKLLSPEKEIFDEFTPKLKDSVYGSPEYKGYLEQMKVALDHHYKHNSHHPEHYENGIDGMSLFDILEMLVNWKAASERHETGDIRRSLQVNKERFKMSPQLVSIFENTIKEFGW